MEKKLKDKKWSYPKRSPLQDLNAKSINLSSSSSSSRKPKVSSTRLRPKSSTNENHLPRPTILKLKSNYPKRPTSRNSNLSKNLKQKEEANGSGQLLDCTPLGKLASSSSGIDSATSHHNSNTASNTTKTPPIEVSVSPEIQSGLSTGLISAATPCYAAGHVLSGVTDKRKCRPRGVLTIGTLIDSSDCEEGAGRNEVYKKTSRGSLVPLPAMASMHWLSSPSRESNDFCEVESVDEFRILNGSAMSELPYSASTFSGSISDLSCADSSLLMPHSCRILQKCTNFGESETHPLTFSNGPSNIASDSVHNRAKYSDSVNRDAARIGGKPGIVQSPGLEDPSSEEMGRNLFPSSPLGISCCHDVKVPDEWKCSCSLVRENSPSSTVSLSSGNVIQTPKSDTSSAKCGGFSWLHSGDHDGDNLGAQLDSVADFLHQTSLSPKAQPSAFDPPSLHFKFTDASWVSDSTFENVSQSQMRISWRDGIVSRIFESDDLDCCRCLSDDENGDYCGVKSSPLEENDLLPETGSQSPEFLEQKHELSRSGKLKSPLPQEANSCAESILTEGGGLVSSADSDWTHSYKNQLYQI